MFILKIALSFHPPVLRGHGTRAATSLMTAEFSFLDAVAHVVHEEAAGVEGDPDQHDPAGQPFLLRREVEIHE